MSELDSDFSTFGISMILDLDNVQGTPPLGDHPFQADIDRVLDWLSDKDPNTRLFCFDLLLSALYLDATPNLEVSLEFCNSVEQGYNAHVGFINLCSPCYCKRDLWQYQRALKPQSGVIGKLSSELILRFVLKIFPNIGDIKVIGGSGAIDAVIFHEDNFLIAAEVKSAPLLTYPFVFKVPSPSELEPHSSIVLTRSQLHGCDSAVYLHGLGIIELGMVGVDNWPIHPISDFIIDPENYSRIKQLVDYWVATRAAYSNKDRNQASYFLANASGRPPRVARTRDGWPRGQSISDGKTSVGMDRTDDIKKGIYQTLKVGSVARSSSKIMTAIVSNTPAYRHSEEYLDPLVDIIWALESDCTLVEEYWCIPSSKTRRIIDLIITLDSSVLRGIEL